MGKMLRFPAMESKVIFIILLVLAITVYGNNDGSFSTQKILEVERKLEHLRKHSLKTIQVKIKLLYSSFSLVLLN